MSRMAASSSYSTTIAAAARSAIASVSAATAATRSPTNRAVSQQRTGRSWRLRPKRAPFTSAPVMTARTPGIARAAAVSTNTMRACGYGLPTNAACSIPGTLMSAA